MSAPRHNPASHFLAELADELQKNMVVVRSLRTRNGRRWKREPYLLWRDHRGLPNVADLSPYVTPEFLRLSVNCNPPCRIPGTEWAAVLGLTPSQFREKHPSNQCYRDEPDLAEGRLEFTMTLEDLWEPGLVAWVARALEVMGQPPGAWTILPPPPIPVEPAFGPGLVLPPNTLPSYLWTSRARLAFRAYRGEQ